MYLILGSAKDPCCMQVEQALRKRGRDVRIVDNLFSEPHRFSWRFGGDTLSRDAQGNGSSVIDSPDWEACSSEIEGVLFRDSGLSTITGWSEADTSYMSTEMQAALLAWLWSLSCVVVNRLPAWLFLAPRPSFLTWIPLLTHAGLSVPSVVIGNSQEHLRSWRAQHSEGAVLAPISTHTHFELHTDTEWDGVLRLASHAPVALRQAHGKTQLACVVGNSVVWNARHSAAPPQWQPLEAALLRFVRSTGLNFVQIAFAELTQSLSGELNYAAVAVDTHVDIMLFDEPQQEEIAEALAVLLMGEELHISNAHGREFAGATALAGGAR